MCFIYSICLFCLLLCFVQLLKCAKSKIISFKMSCHFIKGVLVKTISNTVVCSTLLYLCVFVLCRIIEMNNNSPPLTFKRFQTIVSRLELPRRPLPPITQQQMDNCRTKITDNHDQLYNIPSLEELGITILSIFDKKYEKVSRPSTLAFNILFYAYQALQYTVKLVTY